MMRRVHFDPYSLTGSDAQWFSRWTRSAERALSTLIGVDDEIVFSPRVWSSLKNWFFSKVFFDKCAYCEWKLGRSFGAADHYRPKGRVRESSGGATKVVTDPVTGNSHTGYYWLAYEWRNILPSCDRCNSGAGKVDQFDIQGPRVFTGPSAVDEVAKLDQVERPLLLNPFVDDPRQHLIFGEFGTISAREGSLRGLYTISVLGLDEESLSDDRRQVQDQVRSACKLAVIKAVSSNGSVSDALEEVWERVSSLDHEFSAAAMTAFKVEVLRLTVNQDLLLAFQA